MAPVLEGPFTFSSLLRSQHLLLLLVLGLFIGTDNVPTLLSLAHFTNCPWAATVFPAAQGVDKRQVGAKNPTWPSNKPTMCVYKFYYFYSHISTHTSTHNFQSTSFTGWPGALQLYCGVGIFGGFFDRFHWQFLHNCLYECEIKSKTLLAKNSLFPRSVRTTSLEENGGK